MCPVSYDNALLPRRDSQALNILVAASTADAREIENVLKGAVIAEAERFERRDRFACVRVERLEDARRQLGTWCFDVVLIDRELPGSFDADTLQWCESFAEELPALLLCETADAALIRAALSAGIQACLHKDSLELAELPSIVLRSIDNHALIALSEALVVH